MSDNSGNICLCIIICVLIISVSQCMSQPIPHIEKSNYETCLYRCPTTPWAHDYIDLECPKMCNEIILNSTIKGD